jgi:hypothetical protein
MMMVGLTNAGYLSEKQFEKFGVTASQQFDTLIERGLTSDEALLLMLPTLMALQDAAKLYGFEIDENTQSLINQAREKGILGDKAKTVDDHMLEGIQVIVDLLGEMVTLFGGTLPASMSTLRNESAITSDAIHNNFMEATNRIQDDFNELYMPTFPDISFSVDVDWNVDRFDPSQYARSMQHGGLINKPTLAMTGEGGEPELIGPVGFMSKALEGAISKTGPSEVEREMLAELHGLRSDLKILPLHLRDALILTG